MNRRTVLKATTAIATSLALGGGRTAMARSPDASGYPELTIAVTDQGFVVPEDVTAGRYAVRMVNEGTVPSHSSLGLLPAGTDLAMVEADMSSDSEEVPQWILDTRWVGLPDFGFPGETRTGIVDLEPGTYLGFSPFEGWFGIHEIPGDPISAPMPAATASVDLVEMSFIWGQDPLPSGPQLLAVVNTGTTLHDIQFLAVPDGTTTDHAMEMFMLEDGDSPSPDNPLAELVGDNFAPVAATSILSPGVTTWLDIDLAPGSYLVMCPLPFPSGPPHAMVGMLQIISVV